MSKLKSIYLGALIIIGIFFFQSCNQDDSCTEQTWFEDSDGDGFGNSSISMQSCSIPTGYVSNNTDFDDSNSSAYPDAIEICNGIDDNGNGTIDENTTDCGAGKVCENGFCVSAITYYKDSDGDLFGNPNDIILAGTIAPSEYVLDNTDCNDSDSSIYPGATENITDGVDNNCNGEIDELSILGKKWLFQRHESTSCSNGGSLGGGDPYEFSFLEDNTVSFTEPGSLTSSSYTIVNNNLTLEMIYTTQVRRYKFVGNYVYSENNQNFSGSYIYYSYDGLELDAEVSSSCEGLTDIFEWPKPILMSKPFLIR